ncbi:MAG: FMN-binding glutamate synthase family protein [Chitinophagales bacterium]|nr:FMN-binding glutamate synthase family protein [Chitinophagales bacterium]
MKKTFIFFLITSLLLILLLGYVYRPFFLLFAIWIVIAVIGLIDIFQKKHTLKRNFPIVARMRYFMEEIRPKLYQYFIESDTNGAPFNRLDRSMIYQRSKGVNDKVPFGTQMAVYEDGYEWMNHSINAKSITQNTENPRILIGSSQCKKPYLANVFNISAMSYGSLSKTAISALNEGAKLGEFFHNTGEGGLSQYHLLGGDVVWNIGTGYFSCRNEQGDFDSKAFELRATHEYVKMIEIKFSQGAKPGHGGILPKSKITDEIASIRLVSKDQDVESPPYHSAFNSPRTFVHFVKKLRDLSGGKPVGMKICIGKKEEFLSICKAMVDENIFLDFITVDGGEGGTGAAPIEFSNHVGMPLRDAIAFVYDSLKGFGLKSQIKIIASGKVINGFDIIKALSLGADLCSSARGMMMAMGKRVRVFQYQKNTVKAALELLYAAGLSHFDEVNRQIIFHRIHGHKIKTYEELYPEIPENSLKLIENAPEAYIKYLEKVNLDSWN